MLCRLYKCVETMFANIILLHFEHCCTITYFNFFFMQVITCYLQYWNSSHHEYTNICDFTLSETKHLSFDLPDLNSDSVAVSDKWRVLLDCGSYV